jgi:nucleoside-diphosphate-sugar epimerase
MVPFGDDVPNWIGLSDATRALTLAAQHPGVLQPVYNIAGDKRSIREAAAIVSELLSVDTIAVEAGRFGLEYTLDSTAAERDLGFTLSLRLEEQLADLIARLRASQG